MEMYQLGPGLSSGYFPRIEMLFNSKNTLSAENSSQNMSSQHLLESVMREDDNPPPGWRGQVRQVTGKPDPR